MADLAEHLAQTSPSFRRARLPALYSDFRPQRSLNPDGYIANLTAWQSAFAHLSWDGSLSSPSSPSTSPQRLVLDTDGSLPAKLATRHFGRPLALGAVVREAHAAGDLVPLQDFLSRKQSAYGHQHKGSGNGGAAAGLGSTLGSLPWNVASWAARQLGFGGGGIESGEDVVPRGRYVVLANLERMAALVEGKIASRTGDSRFERTFTRAHFERVFTSEIVGVSSSKAKDESLSAATATATATTLRGIDVDVLLRFLDRDKNLLTSDGNVIRIRSSISTAPGGGGRGEEEEPSITQEDVTVAQLRDLTTDLAGQNAVLTHRIDELAASARLAVSKKQDTTAAGLLRQKKTAEATLRRRVDALSQMEDLAAKIQLARDQVQLVRVLEGSAAVLGRINSEVGGVERVENVVEELRGQVAETDEVGRVLAGAGSVEEAVDEDEVEEELRDMERAERGERERREAEETRRRLEEVGTVPSTEREADKEADKTSEAEGRRSGAATPTTETAELLQNVSLDENPQALPT